MKTMKTRKPTTQEKIYGVIHIFVDLLKHLICMDFTMVRFCWLLIKLTAKGQFEVEE